MRPITPDMYPKNIQPFIAENPREALQIASILLQRNFIQAALWLNPPIPKVTAYENYSYTTHDGILDTQSIEGSFHEPALGSYDETSEPAESLKLGSYFEEMSVECRKRCFSFIEPHYDTDINFSSHCPISKHKIFSGRAVRIITNLSDYTTLVFESSDIKDLSQPWFVPSNSSLIFPFGQEWGPEKHLLHSEPDYDEEIDSMPAHVLVANCLGPKI